MLVLQEWIFLCCFMLFLRIDALGILKHKYISSNITFHVRSLLVMVEPPLTFSCTKNASKLATRNQKRSLRHYSTDIGDALRSSKTKVGSCQNHPACSEAGKKSKTYKNRTLPIESSLEGNERNMEEIGGIWKVGKTSRNWPGSCQNHPTRPEAGKTSQKTYESVCPFSLIPAKATESSWEGNEGNMKDIERHAFLKKVAKTIKNPALLISASRALWRETEGTWENK